MKRIISVMVAVLLLFVSAGCSKDSDKSGSSGGTGGTGGNGGGTAVTLSFTEKAYTIIRPENSDNILPLATKIFQAVKQAKNVKLINADDTEPVNANGEILIGNTNRPESTEAYNKLLQLGTGRAAEYIICVINGNIAIQALSDDALAAAVDKFISDYCVDCTVKSNLEFVLSNPDGLSDMTIGNTLLGSYTVVIPKYNVSYLVTTKIDEMLEKVREKSGYDINVVRDRDQAESEYEIVIDNCNRSGVKSITETNGYEIRFDGNKVYINGDMNYSIAYAVEQFFTTLVNNGSIKAENLTGKYTAKTEDGKYSLVWNDNFDTLDTTTWKIREGKGASSYGGWYNRTTYRSADAIKVNDGQLYMTASYDDQYFYGAWMDTSKSMSFVYGYVEMSARPADGNGIWHDLWTWSDDREHLEFDIMECQAPGDSYLAVIHEFFDDAEGNQVDHEATQAVVTKDNAYPNGTWVRPQYDRENSLWTEFHTFGCEWTEDKVNFTRDGEIVLSYAYTDPDVYEYDMEYLYKKPHYLILSMLTGSNYQNKKPEELTEKNAYLAPQIGADYWFDGRQNFIVDHVQLFQKPGQTLILG